jgi:hypothetical protein
VNDDFRDLLAALLSEGARLAGDADNAGRVFDALVRFGAPMATMAVTREDFSKPDQVVQIGLPPRRIDLLTSISGVLFEDAWSDRLVHDVDGLLVPFIGRAAFVKNKRATRRAKDLADLDALGEDTQG